MKAYEYLGIKSLTEQNWYEMCEVLCNNALVEIDRITSLAKTFNDEAVHCYAAYVSREIEALKAVILGGNESA